MYETDKKKSDFVAQEVVKEAKRLEKKYNYYDQNSLLSKINKREYLILDIETKSILQRAKQYYKITNGIFDITIATIKDIFNSCNSLHDIKIQKEKLSSYVGCEHFKIKRDKIIFDNEFTKIDFGGFVKEYAVDRSVNIIKKSKIASALVNFGGDIYVLGEKPNGEKFKIGIKNPKNTNEHIKFIQIKNQALTTSASYERNYKIEDEVFSHILSCKRMQTSITSATVISNNCVESGVYSTSLMIDSSIKCKHKTFLIKS